MQQNMLETVAWLGVLFLMLDTGLEIDFSIAWRQRGKALAIALTDIVTPITLAFLALSLAACGGGGGDNAGTDNASSSSGSLSSSSSASSSPPFRSAF